MRSTRELLVRNPDFRRLFLATVVSLGGDWFSFVAVAGLVAELTGRPGAPAFVYAATVLPVFLASPFAGALADRFDRKRILVIADLVRVPLALLLCVAAWTGSTELAIAAVIALAVGASFSDPVASAATPNLVAIEQLASAQSLMGAVWGSMLMVGAGIGGIVAEVLGRQAAFAIDAASFLISAWLIAGIRKPMQEARVWTERSPSPALPGEDKRSEGHTEHDDPGVTLEQGQPRLRTESRGSLREAFAYIRANRLVLRLVFAKGGVSSGNGIVGLLPTFASHRFAGASIGTGLLFAARGLGAMIGPLIARAVIGAAPGRTAIIVVCGVSALTYSLVYAVFPLTAAFGVALVLVILAHLGGGAQWSLSTFGLQRETSDQFRGRVLSLDYGIATLLMGGSAIAAGLLADAHGEAHATWWLTAIGGGYGIAWLAWSVGATRHGGAGSRRR